MKRTGWIVWDGQTLRLRSRPRRYGGQVLAEMTLPPEACPVVQAAWDRVEPGEMLTDDPWVRPGTMEARRWTLVGGRAVWPP